MFGFGLNGSHGIAPRFDRLLDLVAEDKCLFMRAALVAMLEAFGTQAIHQGDGWRAALALFLRRVPPDIVPPRLGDARTRGLAVARRIARS